ncbi:HI0074 family nucleotidyltransferase substrate-binding subunit [Thermophilibacter provencensis]|uniref:HI0074 family nucleotidyltransferase substrate-binding subunit n=1 Tax=Thermophilibacter provencensis TaxID=1852386 RepID=UPI00094B4776|nr:HI0074 family nucleotidyltransferase substrate-binding subunit [Thermophilibacter provencensis]
MLFGSRARGANQPQDGAFLLRAPDQDLENEFVQGGVIDKLSLQFELGWKLLRALLAYEGDAACVTGSPRDIIKAASAYYDFMDEKVWLCMLSDRNNTVPVFDARSVFSFVQMAIQTCVPEFVRLRDGLLARYGNLLCALDTTLGY